MYRTGHYAKTEAFKALIDQYQVIINSKWARLTSCQCSSPKLALGGPNGWLKIINNVLELAYLCLKIYNILIS